MKVPTGGHAANLLGRVLEDELVVRSGERRGLATMGTKPLETGNAYSVTVVILSDNAQEAPIFRGDPKTS